jgi:hypothetical protein
MRKSLRKRIEEKRLDKQELKDRIVNTGAHIYNAYHLIILS